MLFRSPADYAVCVFDASGPTFRDDLYSEYKATRSPMPDDLRSQIAPIHEVVALLGWKVMTVPGVEADDVIATLAMTAAAQGIDVIVSSGDKDLSQLVNDRVTIIDTFSEPAVASNGEVHVVSRVVGFKKIKFYTNENIGSGELDLPEQQMHTTSYWLKIGRAHV